jgi:copper chaperone CopZ
MPSITIKIDGMSCGHCVGAIRKALDGVDGVAVENVAVGSATVEYDPNVASPETIANAINATGYTAALAA